MFCPLCKAIYREGVRRCADCEVDLVESLDQETEDAPSLLWSGFDQRTCSEIGAALRKAGIPYSDETPQDYFLLASLRPRFEIRVLSSDRERAQQVLAEQALAEQELNPSREQVVRGWLDPRGPATDAEEGPASAGGPLAYPPEDWDPQQASVEVWAGDDGPMAQMLRDCLRENGIGSRILSENISQRLLVHPEDVGRARKIVHQVIEGVPPA